MSFLTYAAYVFQFVTPFFLFYHNKLCLSIPPLLFNHNKLGMIDDFKLNL